MADPGPPAPPPPAPPSAAPALRITERREGPNVLHVSRPDPRDPRGPLGQGLTGPPTAPTRAPRSLPLVGGGYDRVGGSRLTAPGAVLVLALAIGILSPPTTVDRQVLAVVAVALIGFLILGIAIPLVLVRRISVDAVSPRDATVGETLPVAVRFAGRCAGFEARALDPTGPWHRAGSPGAGEIPHLADRRGVFGALRVEVRVTAPLGVLAAHRVHEVRLPVPVEVAPAALPVQWLPKLAPVLGDDHPAALASATGDLVRSVRPYVSGDPPHLVHWPSSARLGSLVVRELEPPLPVGQAIVLDLRDLGRDQERAAQYALGACRAVLAAGGELLLCTCEAGGPVAGTVRTPLDAGRRLARAVPGPPAEATTGWPVVEIGA